MEVALFNSSEKIEDMTAQIEKVMVEKNVLNSEATELKHQVSE